MLKYFELDFFLTKKYIMAKNHSKHLEIDPMGKMLTIQSYRALDLFQRDKTLSLHIINCDRKTNTFICF